MNFSAKNGIIPFMTFRCSGFPHFLSAINTEFDFRWVLFPAMCTFRRSLFPYFLGLLAAINTKIQIIRKCSLTFAALFHISPCLSPFIIYYSTFPLNAVDSTYITQLSHSILGACLLTQACWRWCESHLSVPTNSSSKYYPLRGVES